jgi:hypothetical protein
MLLANDCRKFDRVALLLVSPTALIRFLKLVSNEVKLASEEVELVEVELLAEDSSLIRFCKSACMFGRLALVLLLLVVLPSLSDPED